jgi:ribose transport system ATP-binding protein
MAAGDMNKREDGRFALTDISSHPLMPDPAQLPFLSLRGISKSYPGVLALSDLSIDIHPGEVIGLVGENGAGKSTLMKILGGTVAADRGTITLDGHTFAALDIAQSMKAGIAFVHQELNLFDNLDAASNIFIGREPLKWGVLNIIDRSRLEAMVEPYLHQLGATFPADRAVAKLSLAQRQLVEIAKALSLKARLVILDEPTSSLPLAETERLLEMIGGLKARGIAVMFVSHRLHEVVAACDRVVVLRDGQQVGQLTGSDITHDGMVKLMVGRDLKVSYAPPAAEKGTAALSLQGLSSAAFPREPIDLDLHRGEILGLAGLVGAGRTELAQAIFGIETVTGGTMGQWLSMGSPCASRPLPMRSMRASISCRRTGSAAAWSLTCRLPRTSRCQISRPMFGVLPYREPPRSSAPSRAGLSST